MLGDTICVKGFVYHKVYLLVCDHTNGSMACGRKGDFLRTVTDAEDDMQLLWQAFPAAGGRDRTTYMFAYADADRRRPSLEVSTPSTTVVCIY